MKKTIKLALILLALTSCQNNKCDKLVAIQRVTDGNIPTGKTLVIKISEKEYSQWLKWEKLHTERKNNEK